MVMCNAFRDHVGCLNILVWISNQKQAEGKVDNFASIYFILVTGKKFIQKKSENKKRLF